MRDTGAANDPENIQALFLSTLPYYQIAELHAIAGNRRDELRYRLTDIGIFDRLLARDPGSAPYRLGQAEQLAAAANASWELGQRQRAVRLAAGGIPVLKSAALAERAAAPELLLAATALLDCRVSKYSDPRLGLILAQRALALNRDDIDTLRTAAKGYWSNGDGASAVRMLERALALLSATPTPLRREMGATLEKYRTAAE